MIEIIDVDGNIKFMSLIICGIKYGEDYYVIYSIKRDSDYDNIFVSKLVRNSEGYVMDNDFSGGEKEALDEAISLILNKENVNVLRDKGISIIKNIKLGKVNKFSVTGCYVTTYKRSLIKECMINYGLLDVNREVPKVREKEVSYFSKGNISIFALIGFGIVILVFCIVLLWQSFVK